MLLRQIQYFQKVVEFRSFTEAAEQCHISQSAISQQIRALEDELGVALFRRVGNRFLLTYAGEHYVEKASEIMRLKEELDAEMADIHKNDVGVLNVAFAKMRYSYMLPCTLPVFRQQFPNVRINVLEGHSEENDRKLLSGQIEVAFYSKPSITNPAIEYHTLDSEELLICASQDHPLGKYALPNPGSRYPRLDLSLLENELVLMMNPEQRTRQIVDGILRRNRVQLKNVQYTSNIQAIIGLVANGYGVSFVFESHLKHRADTLPIRCFSFGDPTTMCDFVAATRKGSYLSRYAQEFIKIVREAV